jgi:predicted nuclease of predicted toxin-antitoxin system
MKMLFDTCMPKSVFDELRDAGIDAEWVGDWDEDPGDDAILRTAHIETRVLITMDKDFGELVVREGRLHFTIVRLKKVRVKHQARSILEAIERFRTDIEAGAIVTISPGHMRCRRI